MGAKKTKKDKTLGQLIRAHRELTRNSARSFWKQKLSKSGLSYSHYAAIENGNRFPDIKTALRIASVLNIKPKSMAQMWAKVQMPDGQSRGYFNEHLTDENGYLPKSMFDDVPDISLVSERDISFFERHPLALEVGYWFVSMPHKEPITLKDVQRQFTIPGREIHLILDFLVRKGIVRKSDGLYFGNVFWILFTRDLKDEPVQEAINRRASAKILGETKQASSKNSGAICDTFARVLSPRQVKEVKLRLYQLLDEVRDFNLEGGEFFYVLTGLAPV